MGCRLQALLQRRGPRRVRQAGRGLYDFYTQQNELIESLLETELINSGQFAHNEAEVRSVGDRIQLFLSLASICTLCFASLHTTQICGCITAILIQARSNLLTQVSEVS